MTRVHLVRSILDLDDEWKIVVDGHTETVCSDSDDPAPEDMDCDFTDPCEILCFSFALVAREVLIASQYSSNAYEGCD